MKHRYWIRRYPNGIRLYHHTVNAIGMMPETREFVSLTAGVRPQPVDARDPESYTLLKMYGMGYISVEITSRQYHRKRWKILQKQKKHLI